jgi:hypothetical protein
MATADLAADAHAVTVGQAHVQHGHGRIEGVDATHGLACGGGLPHDLDAVGFEQIADAAPDDLVVVQQEHGDRTVHAETLPVAPAPAGPSALVAPRIGGGGARRAAGVGCVVGGDRRARRRRDAAFTGQASRALARRLRRRGWALVAPPQSFFVDKKNRLLADQAARAEAWGASLAATVGRDGAGTRA